MWTGDRRTRYLGRAFGYLSFHVLNFAGYMMIEVRNLPRHAANERPAFKQDPHKPLAKNKQQRQNNQLDQRRCKITHRIAIANLIDNGRHGEYDQRNDRNGHLKQQRQRQFFHVAPENAAHIRERGQHQIERRGNGNRQEPKLEQNNEQRQGENRQGRN
ncbi:hypothetical protein ACTHQ2_21965, partial [Bacillus subtilis]|uniref:hypothetical protein n=1 Tax=Bacillus subtilis TaxID=1423 RepID=UPI003F7BE4AA